MLYNNLNYRLPGKIFLFSACWPFGLHRTQSYEELFWPTDNPFFKGTNKNKLSIGYWNSFFFSKKSIFAVFGSVFFFASRPELNLVDRKTSLRSALMLSFNNEKKDEKLGFSGGLS